MRELPSPAWESTSATSSRAARATGRGPDRAGALNACAVRRVGRSPGWPCASTAPETVPGKRSAGLLLYRRRRDACEVFLVHPGGPFWQARDSGAWSIPKGEFNEEAVMRRVNEHMSAGADHVCVQVLTADLTAYPREQWRRVASALQ